MNSVNINYSDNKHFSAIHWACLYGKLKTLKFLLGHKPNLECQTILKKTPLIIACEKNYDKIVICLLKAGVNINHQDISNNTPLHYACLNSKNFIFYSMN